MASIFKVALYKYLSFPLPLSWSTNTIKQKTAQTKHYKNCHRVNRRQASRVPVLRCGAGVSLWSAAGGWVVSGEGRAGGIWRRYRRLRQRTWPLGRRTRYVWCVVICIIVLNLQMLLSNTTCYHFSYRSEQGLAPMSLHALSCSLMSLMLLLEQWFKRDITTWCQKWEPAIVKSTEQHRSAIVETPHGKTCAEIESTSALFRPSKFVSKFQLLNCSRRNINHQKKKFHRKPVKLLLLLPVLLKFPVLYKPEVDVRWRCPANWTCETIVFF